MSLSRVSPIPKPANGGPSLIVGIPSVKINSVCLCGDSIEAGFLDSYRGAYKRALDNISMAWAQQNRVGFQLRDAVDSTTLAKLQAVWPYATDIICNLAANDIITSAATFAQLQGYFNTFVAAVNTIVGPYGVKPRLHWVKCTTATTTSDSFRTPDNQTPLAGFGIGETRDQWNAFLATQVGTSIYGLIDYTDVIHTTNTLGQAVWISNGVTSNWATQDGIHPSPGVSVPLMTPKIQTYASALPLQ